MQCWGLTDAGCVRSQNQDVFKIEQLDKSTALCVVCDGMGGAKAGDVASSLAADVFVEEVRRNWRSGMDQALIDQMMGDAVKSANFAVFDQAKQNEEFSGMGTTLVATLIKGAEVTVVNVGDSRTYAIDEDGIRRITVDHSLVEVMVQRGELTPEEARTYPGKNYITRAVGTESMVECDIYHVDARKGSFLLLCTDGLTNMLDDQELLFEVIHGVKKQDCCQQLLEIAKTRGAPDNVTSVLVQL